MSYGQKRPSHPPAQAVQAIAAKIRNAHRGRHLPGGPHFFAAKGGNGWYICTEAVIIGAGHDKRLGLGMRREGLCGLLAGKRLRQALRCLVTGNKAYAVMCQKSGMNGTDMAIGSKKNQIIFPGTGQDKRIIPHGRAAGAKPGLPCPISLCQKGLSF